MLSHASEDAAQNILHCLIIPHASLTSIAWPMTGVSRAQIDVHMQTPDQKKMMQWLLIRAGGRVCTAMARNSPEVWV